MTPSPSTLHQRVAHRLNQHISEYVSKNLSGEIFFAPLDVVLSEHDVVLPDLLYISGTRKGIVHHENIQGVPDLIIEITSPSSIERDRLIKKELYARFGVQEYWLVDLKEKHVEVLTLNEGRYDLVAVFFEQDTLSTPLFPGLALSLSHIFSTI